MEQFVITPLKTFEKLSKFNPKQNDIKALLQADEKLEKAQQSLTKDSQLQQFASNIHRGNVELNRQRVFQQNKSDEMYEPLGNETLTLSKTEPENDNKYIKNDNNYEKETEVEQEREEEKKNIREYDSGDETDPPLNESNAEEALVHPRREYILKQLKKAKNFVINTDNSIRYNNVRHPMANIDKIADYMLRSRSSPRMRAPIGTDTVIKALMTVPDTKISKISLREDIRDKLTLYKKMKTTTSRLPTRITIKKRAGNLNAAKIGHLLQVTHLPFKK